MKLSLAVTTEAYWLQICEQHFKGMLLVTWQIGGYGFLPIRSTEVVVSRHSWEESVFSSPVCLVTSTPLKVQVLLYTLAYSCYALSLTLAPSGEVGKTLDSTSGVHTSGSVECRYRSCSFIDQVIRFSSLGKYFLKYLCSIVLWRNKA